MPAQLFGGGAPERHRALVLGRAVEDSHDAKPGWTQRVRALRVRRAEGEHRFPGNVFVSHVSSEPVAGWGG